MHRFPPIRHFCALWRDARGNIATLTALIAPIIVLAIGITVDYGNAVSTKQRMQAALDSAVLAGASTSASGSQSQGLTAAASYFASNGGQSWSGVSTSFAFNSGALTGSATYNLPSLFAGITGHASLTLQVSAKAGVQTQASAFPVCVLLLDPSLSQELLVNQGANVNAPNCEIDVTSKGSPTVVFNRGSTIAASETCVEGTTQLANGGTVNNLVLGCTPTTNPYVGKLPAPPSTACTGANANGGVFSGAVTLSPGVYCGWFNFQSNPVISLQPGVYVIKNGGWNVNGGSFTGSGVTFYFADTSHIQYNQGISLSVSPPTTGTYSGILMYEPDGLAVSPFVFDDSVSETMSGLIYLPSRNITFNSTSNETTPAISVIANSAIFDGLNWNLSPSPQWTVTRSATTSSGRATLTQ